MPLQNRLTIVIEKRFPFAFELIFQNESQQLMPSRHFQINKYIVWGCFFD